MNNYKIKTSFVSPEILKARADKTSVNIMIVNFYIYRKLDIITYNTLFFNMA